MTAEVKVAASSAEASEVDEPGAGSQHPQPGAGCTSEWVGHDVDVSLTRVRKPCYTYTYTDYRSATTHEAGS
jgi:hypothetical protein